MTLRLKGQEMGELAELVRTAFPRVRLEELLLFRLDRRADDYVGPADDYRTALRKIIQEAVAALWWRDLVAALRKSSPADPGLMEFAERFALSPATFAVDGVARERVRGPQLELRIKQAQSTFDVGTWRRRLGEIEGRVCRVECPEKQARGTGFLVGPRVILTNYHVVKSVIDGEVPPTKVAVRFDYKVGEDGVTVDAGTVYRLDQDWLIDSSPYSARDSEIAPAIDPGLDELDYALLQVVGLPGTEPVGGPTDDPNPTARGWAELPDGQYDFDLHRALYIVQHPDGKPMQVALDTEAVVGVNGNRTRVRYTTTTEPGSSGSPCFGPDWDWVAMHHSGDPKYVFGETPEFNEGIPLAAIRALLESRGKAQALEASA